MKRKVTLRIDLNLHDQQRTTIQHITELLQTYDQWVNIPKKKTGNPGIANEEILVVKRNEIRLNLLIKWMLKQY